MANVILIDGNALGHASHRSTKLTCGGREVQAIFGMFRAIRATISKFPGYQPLVLWDGKAHWRFELYPAYKSNRRNDAKKQAEHEAYKAQTPEIQKGLLLLGVRQLRVVSAEADDMAGLMSKKIVDAGGNVVLVTGDQDWLQLVNERCVWFDPIRDHFVNHNTFAEFTGYATPEQFLEGKALTGDTSDCIKGVGGIGEKGAPEFLMQYGSVRDFFKLADLDALPAKLPAAIRRFANNEKPPNSDTPMRDAFARNMQLMNLRDVPKPDPAAVRITPGRFAPARFRELCDELAFASITRQFDSWITPFETLSSKQEQAA